MSGQKEETRGDFHNDRLWEKKKVNAIRNRRTKRVVKISHRNVRDFIEDDDFDDFDINDDGFDDMENERER